VDFFRVNRSKSFRYVVCDQKFNPRLGKWFAKRTKIDRTSYCARKGGNSGASAATGNSIRCSVPGLKTDVEIPFPDRSARDAMKKIYKTGELCRVRDRHTEVPWSITYICVALNDSCFTRSSSAEMTLVEEGPMRFIARSVPVPPNAYRSKCEALGRTKSPICMA